MTPTKNDAPTTGDAIDAASAAAHEDGTAILVPVEVLDGKTGGGGEAVDPEDVGEACAALQAPNDRYVVQRLFASKGKAASYGYNLRVAVAAALGLEPQWFTSKAREYNGHHVVGLVRRETPTAPRGK